MANCQEFKQWLTNQDSADENTFRQMENHIQICQTCEKLYHSDMALDTILKNEIQAVEPPPGLITRARNKIESESRPRPHRFLGFSCKTAVPALSMAALVLVILLNPFSGHLQTVDEVVAYSISNHLDSSMEMAFQAGEVRDVGQWFSQRLGYTVRMPNLKKLGLNLRGGRKCTLEKFRPHIFSVNQRANPYHCL